MRWVFAAMLLLGCVPVDPVPDDAVMDDDDDDEAVFDPWAADDGSVSLGSGACPLPSALDLRAELRDWTGVPRTALAVGEDFDAVGVLVNPCPTPVSFETTWGCGPAPWRITWGTGKAWQAACGGGGYPVTVPPADQLVVTATRTAVYEPRAYVLEMQLADRVVEARFVVE